MYRFIVLYVCIYVAPWSCEARHLVPLYVPTCSGMTIKLNLTWLDLFEGEYVACGMAHWEGDYILDEELQIKWCKPTGIRDGRVNGTELRELTEKNNVLLKGESTVQFLPYYQLYILFFLTFVCLVLLTFLAVVVIAAVSCWDCRSRCLEHQEKRNKPTQLSDSSIYGSGVELQRPVWTYQGDLHTNAPRLRLLQGTTWVMGHF